MKSLLDNDRERMEDEAVNAPDREISLGTTMLLGIFFALALLCAVFFGFGYSMGRKSVQAGPSSPDVAATGTTNPSGGAKPSPGKSDSAPAPAAPAKAAPAETVSVPDNAPDTPAPASAKPLTPVPVQLPVLTAKPSAAPVPVALPTSAAGPGTFMVQIAAVTHQEDADALVSALKGKGYAVAIHTEPQDKFMHVQVGPFATRKDAETMRQRILGDGFNAIVK